MTETVDMGKFSGSDLLLVKHGLRNLLQTSELADRTTQLLKLYNRVCSTIDVYFPNIPE